MMNGNIPLGTKSGLLLLNAKQAAEALAISPRKLWGMTASGEIPHCRLGRCLRYPVDDLRRWIDQKKEGGRPNEPPPE
ncbi:MAG: excisionase family DNA binding protein [Pirellulaceae bacterium]|jgi:excisionase family DNA binding protein